MLRYQNARSALLAKSKVWQDAAIAATALQASSVVSQVARPARFAPPANTRVKVLLRASIAALANSVQLVGLFALCAQPENIRQPRAVPCPIANPAPPHYTLAYKTPCARNAPAVNSTRKATVQHFMLLVGEANIVQLCHRAALDFSCRKTRARANAASARQESLKLPRVHGLPVVANAMLVHQVSTAPIVATVQVVNAWSARVASTNNQAVKSAHTQTNALQFCRAHPGPLGQV